MGWFKNPFKSVMKPFGDIWRGIGKVVGKVPVVGQVVEGGINKTMDAIDLKDENAPTLPNVAGAPEIGGAAPSTPPDPPTAATEKDEALAAAIAANKERRRTLLSGFEGINTEAPIKKKRLLGD